MKVGLKDWRFLKSMDIYFVVVVLRRRLDFSHQFRKWSRTGPCPSSPSYRRFTKAVSSAYLIKCLLGKVPVQESIYKINNNGDQTHFVGEPVRVAIFQSVTYLL